jgi:hypothetical protein
MLDVGKHPPVQVSYGPRRVRRTPEPRPHTNARGPLLRATRAFVLFGLAEDAGFEPARA